MSEVRLIDADNTISVLKILSDKCYDDNAFEQAISVLESVPTVDAVQVVRCKDCKYRFVDGDEVLFNCCEMNHNKVQSDDWFCADGERRDPCSSQDS